MSLLPLTIDDLTVSQTNHSLPLPPNQLCLRLPKVNSGDSISFFQFVVVQSLSRVWLFVTPRAAACQPSLSFTISRSLLHTHVLWVPDAIQPSILCCPLLLLPSIFPSIRVFFSELALHIRGPKYWSFSFSISPSMNTQDWFPLGWTELIFLQCKGLSRVFSSTTVQRHQLFSAQPFLWSSSQAYMTTGKTIALTRWTFVGKVMSLLFICCLGLSLLFFPGASSLLIS